MAARLTAEFLLLADGRLPNGGHIHSGGVESAIADGRVHDVITLGEFVRGRVLTVGLGDAALAAAVLIHPDEITPLDLEAVARCPSGALRSASRQQGRGLLRVGRSMWPGRGLEELSAPHTDHAWMWPIALGAVVGAAGLEPQHAAHLAINSNATAPAWSAGRLLGLDPFAIAACLSEMAPLLDEVAERACDHASSGAQFIRLPALATPLLEIAAEDHASWEVRLFAS